MKLYRKEMRVIFTKGLFYDLTIKFRILNNGRFEFERNNRSIYKAQNRKNRRCAIQQITSPFSHLSITQWSDSDSSSNPQPTSPSKKCQDNKQFLISSSIVKKITTLSSSIIRIFSLTTLIVRPFKTWRQWFLLICKWKKRSSLGDWPLLSGTMKMKRSFWSFHSLTSINESRTKAKAKTVLKYPTLPVTFATKYQLWGPSFSFLSNKYRGKKLNQTLLKSEASICSLQSSYLKWRNRFLRSQNLNKRRTKKSIHWNHCHNFSYPLQRA